MNTLLFDVFQKIGVAPFLSDSSVSEIMVNNGILSIERNGLIEDTEIMVPHKSLERCVELLATSLGDYIYGEKPYLEARLPDGSRVSVIYPPVSVPAPCLAIRRFTHDFTLEDLMRVGAIDEKTLLLIVEAIRNRENVLVCGAPGCGKTTLVNAMIKRIPPMERLAVIETRSELRVDHRYAMRLESAQRDGGDLLIWSLRQRTDRIIVGEVRSQAEAFNFLQALNTGHDGSFSTVHANSPKRGLDRIASLAAAGFSGNTTLAREETAMAVNICLQAARLPSGKRQVTEAIRVLGYSPADGFITESLW
jgi:pilus assembly protein CpaF